MFNRMLYGGDYNPNQWGRDVWAEDMRIFRDARINSATVNVFSWAKIQPSEDVYDFSELDDIINMLSAENYDIVLATSTGALPAWMFKRYPEVARVDFEGHRHKFGNRHNACPHSEIYRKYSALLAEKLAERYGSNPHIACWHISNEYNGECYCESCEREFRNWLKARYGTIEALNKAWNMEFWGHLVYDWDEIVVPNSLGDAIGRDMTAFAGMSIDYRRFMSDSMLDLYKLERDAIRKYDKTTPITTNFMGTYKGLDYFKWAKELDVISWDSYPSYNTPWSYVAMCHDLMRGLKNAPFMLMEQTPSQQNWQPFNSLKRPGQMRAQSWQTVAHGANTIQFFQLRRSQGGCEKFHGAVIAHAGHENTRVFREVKQLGCELEKMGDTLLDATNLAKVGIIFDWENYWALEYTSGPNVKLKYVDQIHKAYSYFYERNIPVDMIPVDADFSKYSMVVAPVLYMMKDGMGKVLENYVANGGTFVTGFMSGIVNESDNVWLGGYPGPLRKLCGIWAEEIDSLAPEQSNGVTFCDGKTFKCNMLCDIIHSEGAEVLGTYSDDFYVGVPAVTRNAFGKGHAYYIGTQLEPDGLAVVLDQAVAHTDVEPVISEPTKLEVTRRSGRNGDFYFVMNLTKEEQPLPGCFAGCTDILTDTAVPETLKPWDTFVIKK